MPNLADLCTGTAGVEDVLVGVEPELLGNGRAVNVTSTKTEL